MKTSYDATDVDYELIEVCEIPVLLAEFRIDRATIPRNLYVYDVRHSDYDFCEPAEISESRILVNFFGTIISKTPLDISKINSLNLYENWNYLGEYMDLKQYVMSDIKEIGA